VQLTAHEDSDQFHFISPIHPGWPENEKILENAVLIQKSPKFRHSPQIIPEDYCKNFRIFGGLELSK